MAQAFDAERLETAGDAFPIVEQVQIGRVAAIGIFSVSEQGILAYQTGAGEGGSQLTWFDRTNKSTGVLGDVTSYNSLSLSPDGKMAMVAVPDQIGRADLWLYEVARDLRRPFTFGPAQVRQQAWSPDGRHVVFGSDRKGHFDLYQKASSGVGNEELLLESNLDKAPNCFSPDGRFLLYTAVDPKTKGDLWTFQLEGGQKTPFLQGDFNEGNGQFSPDGHWIAYQSDESRRSEIYAMPFAGPGGKRQISISGGRMPKWRGREIFYLGLDNKLMVVEVIVTGETLEVGAARPLFEVRPGGPGNLYDVTADGQRFLVNMAVEQQTSAPITLVQNWTAELKR